MKNKPNLHMHLSQSNRITEGKLLLFACVILLAGFALVFAAKLPDLSAKGTVNLNASSAGEIASALQIDGSLGERIVEYRESHGDFSSTSAVSSVPLLNAKQIDSVMDAGKDITRLTPGELSRRSGLTESTAERLSDVMATKEWKSITAQRLSSVSVVNNDTITRLDSRLRVRNPGGVTTTLWFFAAIILAGFLGLHVVHQRSGALADPFMLPCVMLLAGLGAVILFSIKDPLRDTYVYPQQVGGILLGIVVAIIPLTRKYRSLSPWRYTYLYALLAVSLTVLLALFGSGPGGAKLKLLGFQPVEMVKLALVFFLASYLSDRWRVITDRSGPKRAIRLPHFRDIGPLLVMYLVSLSTFILVRDLGPMLILFGTFMAMLYAATGKRIYIVGGLFMVGITGLVAYSLHLGVLDVRVDMWLHPWNNSHPNGMQLGQALWGLGTGGLWGSGLGLGMPEAMSRSGSDLIFASIGEELGLVGSLAVLLLVSIILVRGYWAALHARSDFDRFLAGGITTLLGIQTVVILFGVLGILPLTGVSFPFMSYGKSSIVASFFALGILMDISARGSQDSLAVEPSIRRTMRGLATGMLILLLGVAGIGRLVWVQGWHADQIAGALVRTPDGDGIVRPHVNPRLQAIEASIPRGSIYDRNGQVLATSKPSELKESGKSEGRYYPYGDSFAHLIGYVEPKCGGPIGMEKSWNNELRGFDDYSELIPLYRHSNAPYTPKIVGKDIRLTIDAELQSTVEKALLEYANRVRDRRTGKAKGKGAAVVLDIYTGEVLAAVSIPTFDPNDLSVGTWRSYNSDADRAVLVNRALHGVYPPGSTFKLVTAAAALENGVNFTHVCRHTEHDVVWRWEGETYSRRQITDLEEMRSHGETGLAKALRVSCNLFFAHLGIRMGPDKVYGMARKFRISRVPPPKKLVEDLPDNAYGQGTMLVSPLEMARVVATIANKGVMMKPYFVKETTVDGKPVKTMGPEELGRPISAESSASLRKMMADVVSKGTARGLFNGLGVQVAGKTGSAENDQADRMPHSWFVGFAPVDDPRIAFAVVVENGGYGRDVAGPVCREIVEKGL